MREREAAEKGDHRGSVKEKNIKKQKTHKMKTINKNVCMIEFKKLF